MIKKIFPVIILIVIVAAVLAASAWWEKQLLPAQPGSTQEHSIVIAKAQPASVTLDDLSKKGLIKSVFAAKVYLKISGIDQKIQNGTFVVSSGQDLETLLNVLTLPPKDVWVTIPEGWRREQIAQRLDVQLAGPNKSFISSEFIQQTINLEGQLFPDTYLIPATSTSADVVRFMTQNFATKTGLELPAQRDILILASLVEREGKTPTDRPIIAGILSNRIKEGWPLQVDASVQYGRDSATCGKNLSCDWWAPIFDTKFSSAYNTYTRSGLPPAPISNPGLSAINAAKAPAETPYWYYIHSDDGQAHYAQTLQEHNANIDKYLRN